MLHGQKKVGTGIGSHPFFNSQLCLPFNDTMINMNRLDLRVKETSIQRRKIKPVGADSGVMALRKGDDSV
jgi:hypothetical protein